jgi:SAM-dependent methyltransferase
MSDPALERLAACPVCGSASLAEYCCVPSLFNPGERIRYDRCGGCDVVFRNPRLPASARLDSYRDRIMTPAQKALAPRTQTHYRCVARRLRALQPPGAGRRLFDFGCGAGGFLLEARAVGFDPFGLELNRDLARHVRETHGIGVHSGEISDADFPRERFDLITSFQVFEHLLDPRTVLTELVRHLAPGGLLLVEVPNLHDVRERRRRGATMDDSHLFYFNEHSLGGLMRACGLRVVEVEEGLRPARLLGRAAARLPTRLYRLLERTTALAGVTTVLSVTGGVPAASDR